MLHPKDEPLQTEFYRTKNALSTNCLMQSALPAACHRPSIFSILSKWWLTGLRQPWRIFLKKRWLVEMMMHAACCAPSTRPRLTSHPTRTKRLSQCAYTIWRTEAQTMLFATCALNSIPLKQSFRIRTYDCSMSLLPIPTTNQIRHLRYSIWQLQTTSRAPGDYKRLIFFDLLRQITHQGNIREVRRSDIGTFQYSRGLPALGCNLQ